MKFNLGVAFLTFFIGFLLVVILGRVYDELTIIVFGILYVAAIIAGFLSKNPNGEK